MSSVAVRPPVLVDGYHLRFKDRRGRRESQLRHIKLANFPVLNELNRHS
ncbi:hypothetical protein L917_17013 [Phytophthora nicotianae]|uniref:Uncharacterized protein n=1 Tax=Phytophthora nicotianae TaxID=4792 RepID=W2KCT4_PHYNI|nr:hypothetical protein L917_17013 [Phytophthora nicotianae]